MAERSAADMALADAFTEAGYDVKSTNHQFKERLLEALDRMLRRAQTAGAVRADLNADDVLALLTSTCMACGRQGAPEAASPTRRRRARRPPSALDRDAPRRGSRRTP